MRGVPTVRETGENTPFAVQSRKQEWDNGHDSPTQENLVQVTTLTKCLYHSIYTTLSFTKSPLSLSHSNYPIFLFLSLNFYILFSINICFSPFSESILLFLSFYFIFLSNSLLLLLAITSVSFICFRNFTRSLFHVTLYESGFRLKVGSKCFIFNA